MKKLRFTDLFISITTKINFFRLALFGPAFFLLLGNPVQATHFSIAFIDTGFCSEAIKIKNSHIQKALDFTHSVVMDCLKFKVEKNDPRFHGQLVLEEFFRFFDSKKHSADVYPLIVFNKRGDQKKEYWIEAISWIKAHKIDVVVTAAGLIIDEKIVKELPAIWFVPSGRVTPQIKKADALFPQNLAPLPNLFVIGDFYDGRQVLYDQGLLFQDKIDYYFPSGKGVFKGTSRAVAEGSARALNLCPLSNLRDCLKKESKVYLDNVSGKKILTF